MHAEASSAQKSALEQLEAELRATTAARDAVLSRRESEQRESGAASDRIKKQVATLTAVLEETRAREAALGVELAEARAEAQGHASRVDNLETACANANAGVSAVKVQAEAEARARTKDMDGMKRQHEKDRSRWKRECDERDARIAALEAVVRDKDAERVQRVANTVSTTEKPVGVGDESGNVCCVVYVCACDRRVLQLFGRVAAAVLPCDPFRAHFSSLTPIYFPLSFCVLFLCFASFAFALQTMTMEELQGAINYSLRKCFADAKFKLEQPVSVQSSAAAASASPRATSTRAGGDGGGIAQKLSESSGGSPRGGKRSPGVIVARPYHSVRDQDNEARGDGEKDSGGSNSDEIIVMDDDDDDSEVYDLDEDDQNTSIEF